MLGHFNMMFKALVNYLLNYNLVICNATQLQSMITILI